MIIPERTPRGSPQFPAVVAMPPSSHSTLDEAVQLLRSRKDAWASLPIADRIAFLDGVIRDFASVLTEWVALCLRTRWSHKDPHATPQFPSVQTVADVIASRLQVSVDSLCSSRRGRRNDARNLAIHVASRVAGFPAAEICRYFGLGTAAAVTRASSRAVQAFRTRPEIRRLVTDLVSNPSPMCQVKT